MAATDLWTVFQGLGAILAVGLTLGLAVTNLVRNRRQVTQTARQHMTDETLHLENTVKELVELMGGKPATVLNRKGTIGLIDRFDSLESKVEAHDEKLETIAEGVSTLLEQRA